MPTAYEKRVIEYDEPAWDKALSLLADRIFTTYNSLFTPPLVKIYTPYTIKHMEGEYYLLEIKGDNVKIGCTAELLSDFLHRMFLFFGEDIRWSYITENDDVVQALNREYGTETLQIKKVKCNSFLGEYFICTEISKNGNVDGYYSFDEDGELKRLVIVS